MSCHCMCQILRYSSKIQLSALIQCIPSVLRFPTFASNLETSNGFLPVASPVPFVLGSKRVQERAQPSNVAGGGY